jgi:hypothetical protein
VDAKLLVTLALAGLAGACSWHRAGDADAAALAPSDVPRPALGMDLVSVLAVAQATEEGPFRAESEVVRVSRVRAAEWSEIDVDRAERGEYAPEAGTDTVVVALRTCRDWQDRERWSDERASWFLLHGSRLVAFDHWGFGPRCALSNAFRPSRDDAPTRPTERDLLRWLEQRHPPGRVPTALRFERGAEFLAAGRLAEAKAMLKFGDDGIQTREDLFETRIASEEEHAEYERETERLRGLRGDLSDAIRRAEYEASRPPAP